MFVIATIQIPIEIHENGESIPMMDRSHIEVTPCDELPPIQDNPSQLIMEKFAEILATTKKQKEDCRYKALFRRLQIYRL